MTFPDDPLALSQLRAFDFVLNAVFAPTVSLTREQLERALAAARAENAALGQRVRQLERELTETRYLDERALDTYELERRAAARARPRPGTRDGNVIPSGPFAIPRERRSRWIRPSSSSSRPRWCRSCAPRWVRPRRCDTDAVLEGA